MSECGVSGFNHHELSYATTDNPILIKRLDKMLIMMRFQWRHGRRPLYYSLPGASGWLVTVIPSL